MLVKRFLIVVLLVVVVAGGAWSQGRDNVEDFNGHDYYQLSDLGQIAIIYGMSLMASWSKGMAYHLGEVEAGDFLDAYFSHPLTVGQVKLGVDRYYRNNPLTDPLMFAYAEATLMGRAMGGVW